VDEEVDRLYALPLEEFTAARNELAARRRKEGRRDEAAEVARLAKPTLAAWVVNQLALGERERVRDLLELVDRQRDALGRGETQRLREAAEEERGVVRELLERARSLLRERGRGGGDAALEKVATTLRAAAGDPESRDLLERGRLTREVEAPGFGALAGVQPQPSQDWRVQAQERKRELRAELREEQRRARELDREAERTEREAQRAEAAAASARAAAEEAQAAVDRAEAALRDVAE